MKQSAKYFACAAIFVLLFASGARAQSADDSKKDSLVNNFFVPVNQTAKGIRFPYWADGKLQTMFFNVDFLEHKDLEHIQLQNAKITTYDDHENTDLILLLPFSVFDLKTRMLTSDKPFVLKRADFELMGDSLELNTTTKEATIKGKVKIIIFNFQEPAKKDHPHE